jgi:hypothetical protein
VVNFLADWRRFGGSCSNLQAAAEDYWMCWRQEAERSQAMSGRYGTVPESLDSDTTLVLIISTSTQISVLVIAGIRILLHALKREPTC